MTRQIDYEDMDDDYEVGGIEKVRKSPKHWKAGDRKKIQDKVMKDARDRSILRKKDSFCTELITEVGSDETD